MKSKERDKYAQTVSLDICVQKEVAQKLEALLKKSIHEICYDYLSAIPELGLISANRRERTISRRPGGASALGLSKAKAKMNE